MIYDCVQCFDEVDCMDIRLHELSGVVDYTFIIEATRTFSNKPKPRYIYDNRERFAEFSDRITWVLLDDYSTLDTSNPWNMDWGQRMMGYRSLGELNDDDLVIVASVDEIPTSESVQWASREDSPGICGLSQVMTYYWLNCVRQFPWVNGTKIVRHRAFMNSGMSMKELRDAPCQHYNPGGWHFSFLGNVAGKLDAYAHQELNCYPYNSPGWIDNCTEGGLDPFGRPNKPMAFTESLTFLPRYVQQNIHKFRHLIKV